jgi:isoquinoline 1-oxidoreductase alpha subunit
MLKLKVNRREYLIDVNPNTPLLWVLRESLGLTGTKFGRAWSRDSARR